MIDSQVHTMHKSSRRNDEQSFAPKTSFLEPNQRRFHCPLPLPKIFRSARRANHLYTLAPSRARERGASRSSRFVGAGCDGRRGVEKTNDTAADGEVVWS